MSRIYYVEDGFIRGFGTVSMIVDSPMTCDTTGRYWGQGIHAIFPANSWTWIKPIPMKGFQGYRYMAVDQKIEVVGGWLDPRPQEG